MESLLSEEGLGLDFPSQGEIRKGIIATIRENEILVSIGTKSEGILSGREYEQIPEEERAAFEVGQELPVYVVAPEDQNGNVILSYSRAREEQDWVLVAQLRETGESYESVVIGYNKGGLIVPIGRLRGFVPASQVSILRRMSFTGETPEQRWGTLVDEPIEVSVIEMDRDRRRLILSERVALNETRESLKDRLLEELEEGVVRTGRVTSLAEFGAFVNIEGADGLVHLSEISWDRIQHPNEVLEIGQEVEVKVISVDYDRKRIGLSIRQLQDDPWKQKVAHLRDGSLVEGTITHLTKFGAFARISEDLEGLIHVSELSEQRIAHPKEVVHEGDVVTLRVIRIDTERRRIGLSLRKVDSPAYADLDWKMALAEEVDRAQEDEVEEVAEEIEAEAELEEAEETAEDVVAEVEAELEAELEEAEVEAEGTAAEIEKELEVELEEAEEQAEEEVAEEEAVLEAELEETEEALEKAAAEAEAELEAELEGEELEEAVAEVEAELEEREIELEEAVVEAEEELEAELEEAEDEAEGAVAEVEAELEAELEEAEEQAEEAVEEVEAELEAELEEAEEEAEEDAEEDAAEAVEEEAAQEVEEEAEETDAETEAELEEEVEEDAEELDNEAE
jgi:small subunit ribosomal protein S1